MIISVFARYLIIVLTFSLVGCGGGGSDGVDSVEPGSPGTASGAPDSLGPGEEPIEDGSLSSPTQDGEADFRFGSVSNGSLVLIEGEGSLRVSFPIEFLSGYGNSIQLSIEGDAADMMNLDSGLSDSDVSIADASRIDATVFRRVVELTLTLAIASQPIAAHSRSIGMVATSGSQQRRMNLSFDVQPTSKPDVYLLIGQSNMVGESAGGKDISGADSTDPQIRQLNVTANTAGNFSSAAAYTSKLANVVSPAIVVAEDPLHEPRLSGQSRKSGTGIGPGLSFAKRAKAFTTANIVLVPAAYGDTGFCRGPLDRGHWNPAVRKVGDLGRDTLMFDRAVLRANVALEETGGILRGIVMHQGERDSVESLDCARFYSENLQKLAQALRTKIRADGRGSSARGPNSNVPFVVGTMSKGDDADTGRTDGRDWGVFGSHKAQVDAVHRNVAQLIPHSDFANFDDLVPPGYGCGRSSCIHFGATAYREMGERYYAALQRAYANE